MNDLIKANIVVMSYLSDAQEFSNTFEYRNTQINFAKYVILQTKGDLTQEIDPVEMFDNFIQWRKNNS